MKNERTTLLFEIFSAISIDRFEKWFIFRYIDVNKTFFGIFIHVSTYRDTLLEQIQDIHELNSQKW